MNNEINVIVNNNSLNLFGIGYKNGLIKLFGNYNNKFTIEQLFNEQTESIICLRFDPLDQFLYASSKDGSYACYSIKTLCLQYILKSCFNLNNETLTNYEINNICLHNHGLVNCFLANNQINIYERLSKSIKYKVKVFDSKNTSDFKCLTQIKFLKKGEYLLCTTNFNSIYIYNFIFLKLFIKIDFLSYEPIKSIWIISDDKLLITNDKKIQEFIKL